MSGLVKDNIFGSSGSVIAAAGGLSWATSSYRFNCNS